MLQFLDQESLISELKEKARFIRLRAVAMNSRTLHCGAVLSSADIVAVLFNHVLRLDPKSPGWKDRDYFINSRGHCAEAIYVALADRGFFPARDLERVEEWGSHLHGLTATTTPGIEFSCGSLGQGLSLAVGAALGLRSQKRLGRVFVLTGDGECQEGNLWEAAMSAGHYGLDRLTVVVDRNHYQSDTRGTEQVMRLEPLHRKFEAFGFAVRRIDGHDIDTLVQTFDDLPFEKGKPSAIVADTVKANGISFLSEGHNHCGRFGRDFEPELLEKALAELEGK